MKTTTALSAAQIETLKASSKAGSAHGLIFRGLVTMTEETIRYSRSRGHGETTLVQRHVRRYFVTAAGAAMLAA